MTSEQQDLKAWLAKLMQVRSEHPALYKGEHRNIWIDDNLYAYLKVYGDEQVIYVINTSTEPRTLDVNMALIKPTA